MDEEIKDGEGGDGTEGKSVILRVRSRGMTEESSLVVKLKII